jgi:signal peptidase I
VTNGRRTFFRKVLGGLQMAAALSLLFLIAVLLAGTLPSIFGYESFVVYSGSMEPAIHVGDLAVVGPARPDQLTVGDVITYRTAEHPEVVVTHRLVNIGLDDKGRLNFQTKGDANDSVDQVTVDPQALLGRVTYSIPRLGYLVDFSKRPEGKVALIGIPGLLLALDYLLGRGRRKGAASSSLNEAEQLLGLGRSAINNGVGSEGADFFDQAIALNPHLEDAWLLKAECMPSGMERLACLRAALIVNPKSMRLKKAVELAAEQGTIAKS